LHKNKILPLHKCLLLFFFLFFLFFFIIKIKYVIVWYNKVNPTEHYVLRPLSFENVQLKMITIMKLSAFAEIICPCTGHVSGSILEIFNPDSLTPPSGGYSPWLSLGIGISAHWLVLH
jgi:hypothetical protein